MDMRNRHYTNITQANSFLERKSQERDVRNHRPKFHFTAPFGWLNDPNGLIQFKDRYHLFYQYNPFDTCWAQMHWGHAVSDDLINWTHWPIALAPSESYDNEGCYSGSAIEKDGKLYVVYTGNTIKNEDAYQTQNLAVSADGIVFEKYSANPIIKEPPEGFSEQMRDPKIWQHDGRWYIVVGGSRAGRGCALLYRSDNLIDFEYRKTLLLADENEGDMWECPDFYEIDGYHMLTVSVMKSSVHKNKWYCGSFDYETEEFCVQKSGEIDKGYDFYAAQSFLTAQGKRIMIGWQADQSNPVCQPTERYGYVGQLSMPREVSLDNGNLMQTPINTHMLRKRKMAYVTEGDKVVFNQVEACFELSLRFHLDSCEGFIQIYVYDIQNQKTVLWFDISKARFYIDRRDLNQYHPEVVCCQTEHQDFLELHIFCDTNSIDVFINGGEHVMSCNRYAESYRQRVEITKEESVEIVECILFAY